MQLRCDETFPRVNFYTTFVVFVLGVIFFVLISDVVSCEHCNASLVKTIEDLTQHCLVCPCVERSGPSHRYRCYGCNYFSSSRDHMRKHIRVHTGERPFKCEKCPYSARESSALIKHMRTHTGERPHKCYQCNYSCTSAKTLKFHCLNIHGIKTENNHKNFSHQVLICNSS